MPRHAPSYTEVHLAERLASRTDLTRSEALEIVKRTFSVLQDGIVHDGHVVLSGFGTFRRIFNPELRGPGHKYVCFRPGREMRALLNPDVVELEDDSGADK